MQSYQPKKPNRQAYRFYQLEKPKRTTDRIYQHCVSNKEALRAFVKRQTLEERDALQRAADAEHLTPSAWLRRTAVMAARKAGF